MAFLKCFMLEQDDGDMSDISRPARLSLHFLFASWSTESTVPAIVGC